MVNPRGYTTTDAGIAVTPKLIEVQPALIKIKPVGLNVAPTGMPQHSAYQNPCQILLRLDWCLQRGCAMSDVILSFSMWSESGVLEPV